VLPALLASGGGLAVDAYTKELLARAVEGTVGEGGYLTIGRDRTEVEGFVVEWWRPELATISWTQGKHATLADALRETVERLGAPVLR
jgi:hypothetical protein